ncbi:MAG: hypothetical protein KGD70_15870 [Candidatus Lokiarchaeota archaeon]|nr:hypothetical protein [Candidatus Lokiarchaeota archaeon]
MSSYLYYPVGGIGPALLTPIIIIISPLILTGLLALSIYLYEKNIEKLQGRIHKKLAKYDLRHFKLSIFEDLDETNR